MSGKGEWLVCNKCNDAVEFDRQTFQGKCDNCWGECDVKETVTKVDQTMRSMDTAIELIALQKQFEAKQLLLQMLRDIEGLVHLHSIYVCSIMQQISKCHEEYSEWKEAIDWLLQCTESFKEIFGENSIEMMHHFQKQSDLYFAYAESLNGHREELQVVRDALVATSFAEKLMSEHSHESVEEYRQRLVCLYYLEFKESKIYSHPAPSSAALE